MTNKYYTEKILPELLKVINEHKKAGRRAILQEDNDPSHGTKGLKANLAKSFKRDNNIELLKHGHPAQSPDLNPHEGVWNILKHRVRKRKWHTLKELKEIILEEWDRITMDEIRARISEMPRRCEQLVEIGVKGIKTELW
jgi:transposase